MRVRNVVHGLVVLALAIPYAMVMFPIWAARDLFGPSAQQVARRRSR